MSQTPDITFLPHAENDAEAHRQRVMELGQAIIESAITDTTQEYATGFLAGMLPGTNGAMFGRQRHTDADTFSLENTDDSLRVFIYMRRATGTSNEAEVLSVSSEVTRDSDRHSATIADIKFPKLRDENPELNLLDVRGETYTLFDLERNLLQLRAQMVQRKRLFNFGGIRQAGS